jgi:hypothetical protein
LPESLKVLKLSEFFHNGSDPKTRRIGSSIACLDALLNGGIIRGRINEFVGHPSSGRTSLAALFVSAMTRQGEVVGWLDSPNAFDPASMAMAGVDLRRVLWIATHHSDGHRIESARPASHGRQSALLKAAEIVLDAGGFGLVVIDFGALRHPIRQSAALRLARAAERSGAAVLVLATQRACGSFAALGAVVRQVDLSFNRLGNDAPAVFDGLALEIRVAHNKLGGSGGMTLIRATSDPAGNHASPSIGHSRDSDAMAVSAGQRN